MKTEKIPNLSSYSADEIEALKSKSPACERYLNLLKIPIQDDSSKLRQRRHSMWLEAAAATLLKRSSAASVCHAWSKHADQLLIETWKISGADKLPWALFALGKLGAEELNLSSDVDVLLVSNESPTAEMEQCLRQFRHLISSTTEFGFCLRLDFDLRPGGRFAPIITSLKQFEDYYWSQGETWERLALVRLRPIIGDQTCINSIMELGQKFTYRKFLDYSLLSDLKELRIRIQRHLGKENLNQIHLKFAIGGIRDIELFIHALQVIHGGRNPSVRSSSTTDACSQLIAAGVLPTEEIEFLLASYWQLREYENCSQAIADLQTHWLNPGDLRLGIDKNQIEELKNRLLKCDHSVSSLLGSVEVSSPQLPASEGDQKILLTSLKYSEESIHSIWPELIKSTVLSYKSDRDERVRQEFLFRFIHALAKNGLDRDLGLKYLLDFVRSTRAKATFFSLLLGEPRLLNDLARLFSSSPYLASIITSRPELIDSILYRTQSSEANDLEALTEELAERRLLTELICAMQFLVDSDLEKLSSALTLSADEICNRLLTFLKQDFSKSKLEIVALGKWGGRELGLRSDLDLIFWTPETPTQDDFKLARRLIARLNDQHKGGRLFNIDLRLRPSGHAGPLIISSEALKHHLLVIAEAWERQSYLRSRPISPSIKLPLDQMCARGLASKDIEELRSIRAKLIKPQTDANEFDLKYFSGGLVDIELGVQTAILEHKLPIQSGHTSELLTTLRSTHTVKDLELLSANYNELRRLEQFLQLTSNHAGSLVNKNTEVFNRLAYLLKIKPAALWLKIQQLCEQNHLTLKALDPIYRT